MASMSIAGATNGGMIFTGALFTMAWLVAALLAVYRTKMLLREHTEYALNVVFLPMKLAALGAMGGWALAGLFLSSQFWFATTTSPQVVIAETLLVDALMRPVAVLAFAAVAAARLGALVVPRSLASQCQSAATSAQTHMVRVIARHGPAATTPAKAADGTLSPTPQEEGPDADAAAFTPSAAGLPSPASGGAAAVASGVTGAPPVPASGAADGPTAAPSTVSYQPARSMLSQDGSLEEATATTGSIVPAIDLRTSGPPPGLQAIATASFNSATGASSAHSSGGGAGPPDEGHHQRQHSIASSSHSRIPAVMMGGGGSSSSGGPERPPSAPSDGDAAHTDIPPSSIGPADTRLQRLWQRSLRAALTYLHGVRDDFREDEGWMVTARWSLVINTRAASLLIVVLLVTHVAIAISSAAVERVESCDAASVLTDLTFCFTRVAPMHEVVVRARIFDALTLLYYGIFLLAWSIASTRLVATVLHRPTRAVLVRRSAAFLILLWVTWLWRLLLIFDGLRAGPVVAFGRFVSEALDVATIAFMALSVGTASGQAWGSWVQHTLAVLPLCGQYFRYKGLPQTAPAAGPASHAQAHHHHQITVPPPPRTATIAVPEATSAGNAAGEGRGQAGDFDDLDRAETMPSSGGAAW